MARTRRAGRDSRQQTILPTDLIEPLDDILAYSFLFHGEKKIGKTTLANQGKGKTLFLQADPPQKAYRRIEYLIGTWKKSRKAIKALCMGEALNYTRVVIDGADSWYHLCQAYVCEKLAIEHPTDEPWGKGWSALRHEFTSAVDQLLGLPIGVWFLCHSTWKEVEQADGDKALKLLPTLSNMAEEILNGKVDAWIAYDYRREARTLICRGSERVGAGHRLDTAGHPHFRYTNGRPMRYIPAGDSPKETYENLLSAFDCKMQQPQKPVKKSGGKKSK